MNPHTIARIRRCTHATIDRPAERNSTGRIPGNLCWSRWV